MKYSTLKIVLILNIIGVIFYSIATSLYVNNLVSYLFTICIIVGEIITLIFLLRDKN